MPEPASAPEAASKPPRRPGRRPAAIAVLVGLGLLAGLTLAAYVKGSSASSTREDPSAASEGVRCQILDDGADHRPVRCARVVPRDAATVGAAVRDYERFAETFNSRLGTITLDSITPEDEGRVHLVGEIDSVLFNWPIDVRVTHEDRADGARTARWSETDGSTVVNRGQWIVEPRGEDECLLVYELEVRTPYVPNFVVNTFLLSQLSYPLTKVVEHLDAPGA